MLLAYNCRIKEIEEERVSLLIQRKGELDQLAQCRMPLDKRAREHVTGLKRQITKLLNNDEMLAFLLEAQPLLWKYHQLDGHPPANTYQERSELHEEFLRVFDIKSGSTSELRARRRLIKQQEERRDVANENRTCWGCGARDSLVADRREAIVSCDQCGCSRSDAIPDGVEGLAYDEMTRLGSPPYTYKPEQHFTDLLNQVQGKTRRPIPVELIMQLELECRKHSIDRDTINPQMVRLMLRDIKCTEFYDEICAIAHRLNPKYRLVCIKDEDQALLKALFREVYGRFQDAKAHVNPSRKNFMSYPHLAHVLCNFMGFKSYTKEFTWLKNRDKRKAHDEMLEWIFNDIGWHFQSTV